MPPSRAARETVARFINAPRKPGGDLDPRHHGGHQPGRPELGNEQAATRGRDDCSRHPGSTTPISSPGGWSPNVPAPLFGSFPSTSTAISTWPPIGPCWGHRTRLVSVAHVSQCPRHRQSSEGDSGGRQGGRRPDPDRWRPGGGSSRGGCAGHRLRLLRLLRPQKLYGPTGIGVLWGRTEPLERMPPGKRGDDRPGQLRRHHLQHPALQGLKPAPHIAGAIGLAAAIDFVTAQRRDRAGAP